MINNGQDMYQLAEKLFPITRSITGDGVRETLKILAEVYPLSIHEVASGTKVFDWEVPPEWNIKDAYIKDETGKKIIDFKENNLHVLGYSQPIDKIMSKEELLPYIYTQEDMPEAIPYVTSYYKKRFGFCMTHNQKEQLADGNYHVFIEANHNHKGSLTYGEIKIPGDSTKEIFLSTYVCHPSMANNELSGPCVAIYLAKWIASLSHRRYSYRIIFIPETIGSITYLSKNLEEMQENIVAGFNLSCVGDDLAYSYIPSRTGETLADRVAKNVLRFHAPDYKSYTFLDRGSDERQYCSPKVDLPLCCICRSKYGEYKEYHTSLDNMDFISPKGLQGGFEVHQKCIVALEANVTYKTTCFCEPQLGKRGLYPTISQKGSYDSVKIITNLLAYADGTLDLLSLSEIIGVPVSELIPVVQQLLTHNLLEIGGEL